jgi:hypothetical protein
MTNEDINVAAATSRDATEYANPLPNEYVPPVNPRALEYFGAKKVEERTLQLLAGLPNGQTASYAVLQNAAIAELALEEILGEPT